MSKPLLNPQIESGVLQPSAPRDPTSEYDEPVHSRIDMDPKPPPTRKSIDTMMSPTSRVPRKLQGIMSAPGSLQGGSSSRETTSWKNSMSTWLSPLGSSRSNPA